MPSKPVRQPGSKQRRERLVRSGSVSAWEANVGAAASDSGLSLSTLHLTVRGEFQEALDGITSVEVLVVGDGETGTAAQGQSVGVILRCKPMVDCVVTLCVPEFQALLAVATAGRLATFDLRFERPRYGSALIDSVRFGSDWVPRAAPAARHSERTEVRMMGAVQRVSSGDADAQREILRRLDATTSALVALARNGGARLTRAEMCERLGVTSHTITYRVRSGELPKPGTDGKWLLAEVIEWDSRIR